jgi:hypothetical protein
LRSVRLVLYRISGGLLILRDILATYVIIVIRWGPNVVLRPQRIVTRLFVSGGICVLDTCLV